MTWPAGSSQTVTWNPANTGPPRLAARTSRSRSPRTGALLRDRSGGKHAERRLRGGFDTEPYNELRSGQGRGRGEYLFDVSNTNFTIGPPVLSLSINDVLVTEGPSGTTTATFTVTLTATSTSTVTVAYATADGTATAGSDYIATSGTLMFAPGVTTRPIPVTVLGDTVVEANEVFLANLSGAVNATIADDQGDGIITNDDECPVATPGVTDGTFEAGNPWPAWTVQTSTNFGTPLCNTSTCTTSGGITGPFAGSNWAWFGGIPAGETATLGQSVILPLASSLTLRFQMKIPTIPLPPRA